MKSKLLKKFISLYQFIIANKHIIFLKYKIILVLIIRILY